VASNSQDIPLEGDKVNSHLIRKFDMLRRVRQFLDDNAAKLAIVNATAARKEFDQLVQAMAVNESAQATSILKAKSHTATQAVLRRALWNHHMRPIATIAAAHLRTVPGFEALRMPAARAKAAVLVQAALAMAEVARANSAVFVDNGRPENFADALVAAAVAMRASIDARAQSIGGKAEAWKGLNTTGARAQVVLRLLDAQVKSVLSDDPKTLAGWASAKRIGKGKTVPIEVTTSTGAVQPSDAKAA
jgi:hypothetical protein